MCDPENAHHHKLLRSIDVLIGFLDELGGIAVGKPSEVLRVQDPNLLQVLGDGVAGQETQAVREPLGDLH